MMDVALGLIRSQLLRNSLNHYASFLISLSYVTLISPSFGRTRMSESFRVRINRTETYRRDVAVMGINQDKVPGALAG